MFQIEMTPEFKAWYAGLRDRKARTKIADRFLRIERGNLGDAKSVGGGVSEIRVDHGPGYRLYFCRKGNTLIVLLCAGDKSSQKRDIGRAKSLLDGLQDP